MNKHQYSVTHWGSHPDNENDDCWTGDDFDTLAEAQVAFAIDPKDTSTAYVMLDGTDIHEVRPSLNFRPSKGDDSDWRQEQAMQAGMGLGIDAYNDTMGY